MREKGCWGSNHGPDEQELKGPTTGLLSALLIELHLVDSMFLSLSLELHVVK